MAILALISTILIAVAGWIFSHDQARRAAKRNMRISYLLDAYPRLDAAAGRPLTTEPARGLEAALSDIWLLGSPSQVKLTEQLIKTWTVEGSFDSTPLLLDLRISLRRELLLGDTPSAGYFLLRVDAATSTDREVSSGDQFS
jgi:hypothetical protein